MRNSLLLFAVALPVWSADSSQLLQNADGRSAAYNGIGRFRGPATCTAFLVRTADSAPAYAFTNGHCLGFLGANEVVLDRPLTGTLTLNWFIDTPASRYAVPLKRAVWASMKGVDLAIVELQATAADLAARGFRPLPLATAPAAEGDAVLNVGAPSTSIPPGEEFLRLGACTLGPRVDLLEFRWRMPGFLRNDCPDVKGGSSGSPLLDARTGEAIGIVNTGTVDEFERGAGYDCYLNHPCEFTPGRKPRVLDNTSYAFPLDGVRECFDAAGVFDLQRAGCPLDRGAQPVLTQTARVVASAKAAWSVPIPAGAGSYRYKIVEDPRSCAAAEGYRAGEAPRITDAFTPGPAGFSFLCVTAGPTAEFAAMLFLQVDDEPPAVPLAYNLRDLDAAWSLELFFAPPEISNLSYKTGPDIAGACDDPSGYRFYLRVPIHLEKRAAPHRVCVIAEDEPGNRAAPVEIRIAEGRILAGGIVNAASFQRGAIAPGSWIALFGAGLDGAKTATLSAGDGRVIPLAISFLSPEQVNLGLPEDAPTGAAELRLGGGAAPVVIERISPGIFQAAPNVALGYLRAQPLFACTDACRIAPAVLAEGVENVLELYGTGWRWASASEVRARVGVQEVEALAISRHPALAGVDVLRLRLPAGFGLRGYQAVTLDVDGKRANRTWVWLR
jgi:uncharacterized protein (TIGR03437 family)